MGAAQGRLHGWPSGGNKNLELDMPEWFDWEVDSLPLRVDQLALAAKTKSILQVAANSKPV